jgi:hypothetical protein
MMICFFYGFWFDYNFPIISTLNDDGEIGTIVFMTILAVVGT